MLSNPLPNSTHTFSSFIPPPVGDYVLTRHLGSFELGDRFLALNTEHQTSHVAYRFSPCSSKIERTRFESTYEGLAPLRHPHILRLSQLIFVPIQPSPPSPATPVSSHDSSNSTDQLCEQPWIITDFLGDADGIRSLSKLVRQKGGDLSPIETEQAITQILSALDSAHDSIGKSPVFHGPLRLDEILVDRHGRVIIELLGFSRRLRGLVRGNSETIRDELVRVCEIAYQLLTGLRAEEPLIPAKRLVPRLSIAWEHWLDFGLDPSRGFESARQALLMLPSALDEPEIRIPSRLSTTSRA